MFNSPIIDIAISIVFILFIFSSMASMVLEVYTKKTQQRAKLLASCLRQNLNDEYINQVDFSLLIYSHPLISGMKEDTSNKPSYIASDVFATALIDVVINYGITTSTEFNKEDEEGVPTEPTIGKEKKALYAGQDTLLNYRNVLEKSIKTSSLHTLLSTFSAGAKNYNELHNNIMVWYDHYMDRVTGWYKKRISSSMFWISAAITLLFNIDSIHILKSLQENATMNAYISTAAKNYVETNSGTKYDSVIAIKQVHDLIRFKEDSFGLPIGYTFKGGTITFKGRTKTSKNDTTTNIIRGVVPSRDAFWNDLKKQIKGDGGLFLLILGYAISTFAIAKGAPFWFDILSKLVNVRSAGVKPKVAKSVSDG